ncbi:glycosyltransferase [bacterium]|nr:glycosyltransferase [bacterium]
MSRRIWVNLSMVDARPGGVGRYSIRLLEALKGSSMASKMVLLLPEGLDSLRSTAFDGFEIASIPAQLRGDLFPRTAPFYRFAWNRWGLNRWVGKRDLIYAPSSHGAIQLAPQTAFTIHDTLALAFPDQHKLQHRYFKSKVAPMARKARSLISVSAFSASEIRQRFGLNPDHPVHIVPPAVDDTLIPEVWSDVPERFFLVVGATYPHKNIDVVLDALRKESCRSMKLLIAGAGLSYGQALRKRVEADRALSQRVQWAPYLSEGQMRFLFSKAEALLFPSVYEGFGMPVAEAVHWGLKVLASDIPVLSECFGPHIEKLPPHNPDAWAEALIRTWGSGIRPQGISLYRWSDSAVQLESVLCHALET